MRSISQVIVLCACLSLIPAAAQEKPGLVERAKKGFKQILELLLQDYGGFLDEVDRVMQSGELRTDGDAVVIKLNTSLTTLKTDAAAGRQPGRDTPVHEVNHLTNGEIFLQSAASEAIETLTYMKAMGFETAVLEKYANDAPKKAEVLLNDLRWVDKELRGMVERLSGSPTLDEVQREKRLLMRIQVTLKNVSHVLAEEVERGDEWLDEIEKTVSVHTEGIEKIRRFQADKVEGKAAAKLLPAVVQRVRSSTQSWLKSAESELQANTDARKDARKALDPFVKETLFSALKTFKDVKFADLAGTTRENEEFLKVIEDRLKGR